MLIPKFSAKMMHYCRWVTPHSYIISYRIGAAASAHPRNMLMSLDTPSLQAQNRRKKLAGKTLENSYLILHVLMQVREVPKNCTLVANQLLPIALLKQMSLFVSYGYRGSPDIIAYCKFNHLHSIAYSFNEIRVYAGFAYVGHSVCKPSLFFLRAALIAIFFWRNFRDDFLCHNLEGCLC